MSPPARATVAVCLALAGASLAATGAGDPIEVPEGLDEDAASLEAGLSAIADAEGIEQARQIHAGDVEGPAERLAPYLEDLAGREGELLATYLERLDASLEDGNLSDARSLAGAGANQARQALVPAAQAWEANRTALAAGPVEASEQGPRVSLVLVNPPPGGIAALDVEMRVENATPTEAQLAQGQGETQTNPANGSVRWASFDAANLAGVDADGPRTLLGQVQLDVESSVETITTDVDVHQLADADGREVPAVGLAGQRQVPEDAGSAIGEVWIALAGVTAAAGGLAWWVRGWEV